MRKFFSLFAALTLSVGLWADGHIAIIDGYEGVRLWQDGPYWATMNVDATNGSTAESWYGNLYTFGNAKSSETGGAMKWGSHWFVPTETDFIDILDWSNKTSCIWIWRVNYNGVLGLNGYVVKGQGDYANDSIFLPAAGSAVFSGRHDAGIEGGYWSSTEGAFDDVAHCLLFDNVFSPTMGYYSCGIQYSVRLVCYDNLTAVHTISVNQKNIKVIHNGQLFIRQNDQFISVLGQKMQ